MTDNHMPCSPTKDEIIRRAERARAILDDPLVKEAFAQLEQDCLSKWRHSRDEDSAGRERLYQSLRLIDQLRQDFTSLVLSGRMTQAQAEPLPGV